MATVYRGTGRRKSAVARVRLSEGTGRIFVNSREADDYFSVHKHVRCILAPLEVTNSEKSFDIQVKVTGGGMTGQAGAVRLGIARALASADPEFERSLREGKFVTRDARVKERKKYGRRGARRGFQFSKR
jgi:small subunit ribosomal protein S9